MFSVSLRPTNMFRCGLAGSLAWLVLSGIATAVDLPNSRDHPMAGRFQGSEITYFNASGFDETALLQATHDYPALLDKDNLRDRSGVEWLRTEGSVTQIRYAIPVGHSSLEVTRSFEAGLASGGFQTVFSCADAECFTGNLSDPYLLGQQIDVTNGISTAYFDHVRYFLAKAEKPSGTVYAAILTGEDKEEVTAFVVVVEPKAMETGQVKVLGSTEMQTQIAETGKVAIYGLQFDFDKADLQPESAPTLAEINALLHGNPEMKLEIVGHTDNKGSAEYNMDLSARRAASVVATLTGTFGIDPARLGASGAGASAPIADNNSDEGRAKNRRVELVAK